MALLGGPRSFVGLDVGSHGIKVVGLGPAGVRFRVLYPGKGESPRSG